MNNLLVPAAFTAALKAALQDALSGKLSAKVTVGRPDEISEANRQVPSVNICLFQVEVGQPLRFVRDADSLTGTTQGSLGRGPWASLNLYYLFTFYGNEHRLEPPRLLNIVAPILNTGPGLSPKTIEDAVDDREYGDYVAPHGLAREIEAVRISPLALSEDEMSKFWSVFLHMPYRLSVAYLATNIFIEAE
ncbi:MAG TPA: DUF4255 domain-containing protein [Acidobacteriota bacterium]|nr:DUF4255 domain-containing protein [Acidobacteriota bacterium]